MSAEEEAPTADPCLAVSGVPSACRWTPLTGSPQFGQLMVYEVCPGCRRWRLAPYRQVDAPPA